MTDSLQTKESKPLFLYDGGIHAREWAAVSTIVYIIDRVLI